MYLGRNMILNYIQLYLYSIAGSITVQYTLCIYLQASNLLQGIEIDLHR